MGQVTRTVHETGGTPTPVASRRSYVAIFRGPDGDPTEVVVPLDRGLADYADAIETVARKAAVLEGRTVEAVLHDLLQPQKDIVRYAVVAQETLSGSIDLPGAVALLGGAKKSLLASAMSVKRPVRFHPRMSLSEADAFVSASRVGQTEVGSFVLMIETPHNVGAPVDAGDALFGRRATQQLLRSTNLLTRAIRQDTIDALLFADLDNYPVSANLCEALVEMMPSDESADLRIQCSWSPLLPTPSDVESEVRIDRPMFETIDRIAQRLRPSDQPIPDTFYAYVTELAGGIHPEGDIRLRVLVDDGLVETRANLASAEYARAGEAHLKQKMVAIRGVLHRGRRVHELRDISSFQLMQEAETPTT